MKESGHVWSLFFIWLVKTFGYTNAVFLKDTIGTVAGILLGLLIGITLAAYVCKNAQYIPDEKADRLKVTNMSKNGNSMIWIIVPKKMFGHLTIPTTIVLFLQALFVKVFPIKHLHFVDNIKIRIVVTTFIILSIVVCILCIYLDFHVILPSEDGFKIYRIQ